MQRPRLCSAITARAEQGGRSRWRGWHGRSVNALEQNSCIARAPSSSSVICFLVLIPWSTRIFCVSASFRFGFRSSALRGPTSLSPLLALPGGPRRGRIHRDAELPLLQLLLLQLHLLHVPLLLLRRHDVSVRRNGSFFLYTLLSTTVQQLNCSVTAQRAMRAREESQRERAKRARPHLRRCGPHFRRRFGTKGT